MEPNWLKGPMPMGLGMALFENPTAAEKFACFSAEKQRSVIEHTHQIQSKQEMRAFVQSLTEEL